jgi:hypothetical protein
MEHQAKGQATVMAKVIPKSPHSRIEGFEDGVLKARLRAAPERGKANDELIGLIAAAASCPKSSIRVVSGATSRHKKLIMPIEAFEALSRISTPE